LLLQALFFYFFSLLSENKSATPFAGCKGKQTFGLYKWFIRNSYSVFITLCKSGRKNHQHLTYRY